MVQARVERDDGERGLVLRFCDLSQSGRAYLRNVISFLPILAVREEEEEGAGVIISEIMKHRPAAAASS